MLVVLVDGELWTDESVFWQNKLQDRAIYEVVYRTNPAAIIQLTCIGKPSFYQFLQTRQDRQTGVPWDTEVPLARVPIDEPPKAKIVHVPSRRLGETHLP